MTETVTISRQEYDRLLNAQQDLRDSEDCARIMAEIAAGAPTLTSSEVDDYLATPLPLAFWRRRAGKTQATLAAEVGISQAFLAQIEGGKREGTVGVLAKLAKALRVRMEDLLVD